MLRAEKVKYFRSNKKLKSIYLESFPKRERYPLWRLKLMTLIKGFDFFSFYDDERMIGLAYLVSSQNLTFLLYLAVDRSFRSKGYGSQILQWIKGNIAGTIVLDIDTVREQDAPDYEQRISRKRFYERNGFRDTGDQLLDDEEIYDVLACGDNYNKEEYTKLLKRYFRGFYKFTIQ